MDKEVDDLLGLIGGSTSKSSKQVKPSAPKLDDVDDLLKEIGIDSSNKDESKKKKKKQTKKKEKKETEKEEKVVEEPKVSAQAKKIQEHIERVKKEKEERDKREAEERARIAEINRRYKEEQDRLLQIKEDKKKKKRDKIEKEKLDGTYQTPSQKKKQQKEKEALERMNAFYASKQEVIVHEPKIKEVEKEEEKVQPKIELKEEEELLESWEDFTEVLVDVPEKIVAKVEPKKVDLRSAICCVLGHVDTGKTKLLDRIRHTNVQEGEAGGITQQIGATFFPIDALSHTMDTLKGLMKLDYKIPGLLMIDTPGHESFSNLRSRGSNLCDIAVLVVDIMHGLENQTLESLELLKAKKCPFVVALNKIDRIYQWRRFESENFRDTLSKQTQGAKDEFEKRLKSTILLFNQKGYNAALYYNNDSVADTISLIPTSAVTGQGIPDLLCYMTNYCQKYLSERLTFSNNVDCTVLELKTTEGFGTTIDVILVNGELKTGDRMVLCGLNGPIVREIRVLLTPEPLREIRTKSNYIRNTVIKAAMGIKISAPELDDCVPGTPLFVCNDDSQLEYYKHEVSKDLDKLKMNFKKSDEGVWVQSSSLGSLEALLDFLGSSKPPVPVSGFNIGPLSKRDITEASIVLNRRPELGVILAFDIKIDNDIESQIKQAGLKLFSEKIIYRLFDSFTLYMEEVTEKNHKVNDDIIFPCELECTDYVFRNKNPIIMGVDVVKGILKVGTPVFASKTDTEGNNIIIPLGKISNIESNKTSIDNVKPGGNRVAISIQSQNEDQKKLQYGRNFDQTYKLYSQISRASIEVMKNEYRDKLQPSDWVLMKRIKEILNIPK